MATSTSGNSFVRAAAWVAIALAAAAGVRYAIIEPVAIAHLCSASGAPWWCAPRALAAQGLATGALGLGAIATGIAATFTRSSSWALGAACLGAAGLVLYGVATGAAGFLLGLLVLARSVAAGRHPPHARREGEA